MRSIDHIAGETWHGRVGDTKNAFRYSIDYVLTDAEADPASPAFFARNGRGLMSLHDSDHGGAPREGRGAVWVREVLWDSGKLLDRMAVAVAGSSPKALQDSKSRLPGAG